MTKAHTLSHCTINMDMAHNQHSQAAIEAVANALSNNAKAIEVLARQIEINNSNVCAVRIEDTSEDY